MTYLELINAVLVRLREDTISSVDDLNTDPYYRFIGSAVNDAKDRVEDAWQWSALRAADAVPLDTPSPGTNLLPSFSLPNSADNHYILKGVYVGDAAVPEDARSYRPVRFIDKNSMIQRYLGGTNAAGTGTPYQYTVNNRDSEGNIAISVYPNPEASTTEIFVVDRVNHQPELVAGDDRILVPSLPVYTLATALASRERGEVGGTPTSELFTIADRHLSDAIAQDSALYPSEMDWYSAGATWTRTNIRYN